LGCRTLCLLAIALLAGCGGGAPKSDPDQISQVLTDAAKAVAARDGSKACGYLTPEAQQQVVTLAASAFGGADCAAVVNLATATLAPLDRKQIEDAQPQNIAVTGTTATAEIAVPSPTNQSAPVQLSLQKTTDGWRISALANLPA
jgi:ketosteroid isomerase-like protein